MGLEINQTFAKLNIQTTPSELSIRSQNAKLELSHKQEVLNVHSELPRVVIDQYDCFATSGLMNVFDLTREAAAAAMQQAITYASRVAGEGDTMAAIQNKGDPIPALAEQNANPEKVFDIDVMPKARPKITVTGGGVEISPAGNAQGALNGVSGNYSPGSVSVNYTPSKVNISMAQYASLNIRSTGTGFDSYA